MEANAQVAATAPDGGWGWVVVFASFIIHVIADGIGFSFGVLYVEFLDYFKESHSVTGWVGSLLVGLTWGSGPLASALINRFECRVVTIAGSFMSAFGFIISIWAPNIYFLYFSIGIIGGVGLGLIYLPAIVSVTYYFEKQRSFAIGLAMCGTGVGTFVFAPLTTYIVEEYTWKGAVLILAGILLNCIICGALFRPLEIKKGPVTGKIDAVKAADESTKLMDDIIRIGSLLKIKLSDEKAKKALAAPTTNDKVPPELPKLSISGIIDFTLLNDPLFLIFTTSTSLISVSYIVPYMFLPDRAILKDIDPHRTAFLISIIGISSTVGRVVFGWLSDKTFVNRLYLYNITLAICGMSTSLSAFCETFELLCGYSAVFGISSGVYAILEPVLVVDLIGLESFSNSFGLLLFFKGIAAIIGPPIASSLYDATGSYDIPFYIMGALISFSGIILFCVPCIQRRQEQQDTVTKDNIDLGKRFAG